ncbi:hypothetical protein ANTPLA_LOCUS6601 [Anthophora plagiata]
MAKDALLNHASTTRLTGEVARSRCSPVTEQRQEVNNYARLREANIENRCTYRRRRDRIGIKEVYFGVSSINRFSTGFQACHLLSNTYNMKCIAAVVFLALVSLALAKPLESESLEPAKAAESVAVEPENAARDKRGLLVGAAYTAPVAYSAYTAPVAYTAAAYSYPYAAYSSYPYYASAYSAPYYVL